MKTYKFRIKGNTKELSKMASAVNFVWNYCNQTSIEYLDKRYLWLSEYDLHKLTSWCTADLKINSATVNKVCGEYVNARKKAKARKLSWRSYKRSLGWIPFKDDCISMVGSSVRYRKHLYKVWLSRPIEGKVKCGSFSQDSKGNWYVNLVCDPPSKPKYKSGGAVGVDLGLKTIATLSNGTTLDRENITTKYAPKLTMAQKAKKKRLVTAVHTKIKNVRRDWNHKTTTKLINQFDTIIVGNVSPSRLKKTRMAKSVSDASWADFKSMLAYKAIALGVNYKEVNESYSTVTCSTCFERTGPSGLSALGVREWTCSCGAFHNRDVNAAKNILRLGHQAPIKGVSIEEDVKKGMIHP